MLQMFTSLLVYAKSVTDGISAVMRSISHIRRFHPSSMLYAGVQESLGTAPKSNGIGQWYLALAVSILHDLDVLFILHDLDVPFILHDLDVPRDARLLMCLFLCSHYLHHGLL